jgi:predicted metalloprotease with PDZ domain
VAAGVPAFFWQQSEKGYERVHHTQHDTFENTPLDDVRHSAKVVAAAAVHFAMLDHRLDRTDMKAPPRRTMGVRLGDACELERVESDSRAGKAGLKQGDKVLSIDGTPVASRGEVTELVQRQGARQVFVVQRGAERIEAVLDWSDDPDEVQRAERAKRRAERARRQ